MFMRAPWTTGHVLAGKQGNLGLCIKYPYASNRVVRLRQCWRGSLGLPATSWLGNRGTWPVHHVPLYASNSIFKI